MILHLQSLHFPIKIPSKFQAFSNTPSPISFFLIFDAPSWQNARFWHPLAPGSAQNDTEITQVAPKMASENSQGNHYLRTCSQGRFRIVPGHQCGWFWMDLGWIWDGFWWIWDGFWHNCLGFCLPLSAAAFTECQRRAGTKRSNGKRQEHADVCRNMQKRKNVKKTHK